MWSPRRRQGWERPGEPGAGWGWEMLLAGLTVNIQQAHRITLLVPLLLTGPAQRGVRAFSADGAPLKTVEADQQVALFLLSVVKFGVVKPNLYISLEWGGRNRNVNVPTSSFP